MSTRRAGRTAIVMVGHSRQSPIPSSGAPRTSATPAPPARRRSSLSHAGHAVADLTGFDGEVCVRYEAVYRRAEPASGERRLLLAVLEDGIRTFLKNARATHGRAFNL